MRPPRHFGVHRAIRAAARAKASAQRAALRAHHGHESVTEFKSTLHRVNAKLARAARRVANAQARAHKWRRKEVKRKKKFGIPKGTPGAGAATRKMREAEKELDDYNTKVKQQFKATHAMAKEMTTRFHREEAQARAAMKAKAAMAKRLAARRELDTKT